MSNEGKPFDRKRAISDMIEAMVAVKKANTTNLNRARQQLGEAEDSVKAYHMMDAYVAHELNKLVEIKRKIEEDEKNGQG